MDFQYALNNSSENREKSHIYHIINLISRHCVYIVYLITYPAALGCVRDDRYRNAHIDKPIAVYLANLYARTFETH